MGYRQRIARVCEYHEVKDLNELCDKYDLNRNIDDIRCFIDGRIPAWLEPPLLGRAEVRKSPLFD